MFDQLLTVWNLKTPIIIFNKIQVKWRRKYTTGVLNVIYLCSGRMFLLASWLAYWFSQQKLTTITVQCFVCVKLCQIDNLYLKWFNISAWVQVSHDDCFFCDVTAPLRDSTHIIGENEDWAKSDFCFCSPPKQRFVISHLNCLLLGSSTIFVLYEDSHLKHRSAKNLVPPQYLFCPPVSFFEVAAAPLICPSDFYSSCCKHRAIYQTRRLFSLWSSFACHVICNVKKLNTPFRVRQYTYVTIDLYNNLIYWCSVEIKKNTI